MERKRIRKWCRDGFLVFIGAMAVFTVLSRSLDSLTVPSVGTAYAKAGNVNYEITGDGTFTASGISYINPEKDLKVQSVNKEAGQKVEEGDVLFVYQMEGIRKKKEEIALSIEKMKLEIKQAAVQAQQIPDVPEETPAQQSLDAARRALDYGNQDLEQLKHDSEEKLVSLKRNYNRSMDQSEEDMEKETRRQYRDAQRAYDEAVSKKKNEVNKAQKGVSNCEKTLERDKEKGEPDEVIEKDQDALDLAKANLDEVQEEQEQNVEDAKAALNNAEEDYGDVNAGRRSAAETLKSSYESSVEAINEQIKAGEKNVRDLEEALAQAELAVSNAKAKDAVSAAERQKNQSAGSLGRQEKQLNLKKSEEELKEIERLEAASGEVYAPQAGVVTQLGVESGKTVTGEEIVAIGGGNLEFSGKVDKKLAKLLVAGTKISIQYGESERSYDATVKSTDYLSDEDQAGFTASFDDQFGELGATASFQVTLKSQQYKQVIPIAGLRQESTGYYVLAAATEKTILGEEQAAEKIPVTLLEKSSTQAAVEGALTTEDQVIVSSGKIIEAGDRVRTTGE